MAAPISSTPCPPAGERLFHIVAFVTMMSRDQLARPVPIRHASGRGNRPRRARACELAAVIGDRGGAMRNKAAAVEDTAKGQEAEEEQAADSARGGGIQSIERG